MKDEEQKMGVIHDRYTGNVVIFKLLNSEMMLYFDVNNITLNRFSSLSSDIFI